MDLSSVKDWDRDLAGERGGEGDGEFEKGMVVWVGASGAGRSACLGAGVGLVVTCGADVPGDPDDPDRDQLAKKG